MTVEFKTNVTESKPQISIFYLFNDSTTQNNMAQNISLWRQINFQVILVTRAVGVGRKDMITFLGILDITEVKSKIGHHVLKVVDDKIGPII